MQTQAKITQSTRPKMKKFVIREAEAVKTTAAAAYPIWMCWWRW